MNRGVQLANAAFAILLTGGATACAQSLLQFDFVEMQGVYTSEDPKSGGVFRASAASEPGYLSAGLVRRDVQPAGEALFDTGFVGEPNPADVAISLTFGPVQSGRASTEGTIVLTDVDGDTIALWLAGTMSFSSNGQILCVASVTEVETSSDEGLFDGSDGGSVSLADVSDARGHVNIAFSLRLTRPGTGPTFVQTACTGALSGVRGVPAPASAGLMALCAIAVAGRRRPGRCS